MGVQFPGRHGSEWSKYVRPGESNARGCRFGALFETPNVMPRAEIHRLSR